jgi:hypothetical protein
MANTQKIKIDGVEYALNEFNEQARNQLLNLRTTDQEIARLQAQLAIAQTARAAYASALRAALPQAATQPPAATKA